MAAVGWSPQLSRRVFCSTACRALPLALVAWRASAQDGEGIHFNVAEYDRTRILHAAEHALKQEPRSAGAIVPPVKGLPAGSYFSEDPEWWPAAGGAAGEAEHRPGRTNLQAFSAHRDALVQMNGDVSACVAAWRLTREERFAAHAMRHLQAWFLDGTTAVRPDLEHAGCLPGQTEGTPRGVEDAVMLAETARAAAFLCAYDGVPTAPQAAGLREWFGGYGAWLNESKKGTIARESKDRLAVCWTLQAAACAGFARDGALQLECLHRFRDKLLRQMNFDGQFPAELHRPDAYAASIFTLDCMSVLCELLSSPMDRLWDYSLADGRGMRSAIASLYPALEKRGAWKFPADAEHFSDWPVRQPSLLLAGRAYGRAEYIATWKRLPADPALPVVLRRLPVREPALWTVRAPAA